MIEGHKERSAAIPKLYCQYGAMGSSETAQALMVKLMFGGSKRLFEIADSLTEIKSVCKCGHKAEVNARIKDGKIVREGEQILMGGTESSIGVCCRCWKEGRV